LLERDTTTSPMSLSLANCPDGSIDTFLPPTSRMPPGAVMLRAEMARPIWPGCTPLEASRSCEYSR
jgi:hypothetical protein